MLNEVKSIIRNRRYHEKERVDVLAFNQGLFETREKAKRGVMAGLVYDQKMND